jgi:hypothetical protein
MGRILLLVLAAICLTQSAMGRREHDHPKPKFGKRDNSKEGKTKKYLPSDILTPNITIT